MSLNIKNDETCRLADQPARLTGETKTGAITVALRERLEREQHARGVEARLQRMRATRPDEALRRPVSGWSGDRLMSGGRQLSADRPDPVPHDERMQEALPRVSTTAHQRGLTCRRDAPVPGSSRQAR